MMSVTFGPFAFATVHLIFFIALVVAFGLAWILGRKYKVNATDSVFRILAVGLLFARISFVIRYFSDYASSPWQILNVRDGGFDLWAGVIAGVALAGYEIFKQRALFKPVAVSCLVAALAWTSMHGFYNHKYGNELFIPEVRVSTLDDRPVFLHRAFRGQPVVMNLWATWCPPCVREMPLLEDAQTRYPDVAIVTVNQGEDAQLVREFMLAQGLDITHTLLDPNSQLGTHIQSFALPTTLFFDANGMLIDTHVGEFSAARLNQAIRSIRRSSPVDASESLQDGE
ncbi:TlpA family protein disulfide reductase [Aliidiomarina halalkaliphila]|uniref:TlpA family protein disulfide reductase n=1 Tax=Aliidiomarina halalkaliphila TaxID=2593535 RepID=A0A552X4J6_9GAMM|nr:TlpA disulfide reductase family protein [Aliidiomarina halalkaliphila]TRW49948.1 TlpA family protein disulfide reductase [Aliidiomarina halalkaliphila]